MYTHSYRIIVSRASNLSVYYHNYYILRYVYPGPYLIVLESIHPPVHNSYYDVDV
jgi:hypothetical protein